ncbi:helix-turn-helix domain-containing protein [Arthrobacter sp. MSA 4-2]|uniref:helix-turn-helix transcriptional regulator n=1 Tax=Arthrobacter sp. MSA 4-2 TaxID=2794349 RepID=UPI0018E78933|nr:helix-turn-helix transcriptional regulator [Arthrobacter sp. MSA 4-2]MBJ2122601.1 helix-turn-helix domain-containing protein [Arthrobacter sp. MSA 4-2]
MRTHSPQPEPSRDRGVAGPPLTRSRSESEQGARTTSGSGAGTDGPANALGAYLRARREMITPAQAGIPVVGARRVPGLRREEVAMLAGISADYYLRLERGRDRHPSVQVLEAIARVLQLDDDHFTHLLSLVAEVPRQRQRRPRKEIVPPGALKLLESLNQPAFIEGRYFDVLASNPLAKALSPRLEPGRNQLMDMFLDPAEQALQPQWKDVAECFIANLRQSVGTDIENPRFVELVGELSLTSPLFAQLWARYEVRGQKGTMLRFNHPQVGELLLNRERLSIGGAEGLMLVVFHPDAGSDDADKLSLLASAGLPVIAASKPLQPERPTK